MSGTFPSIHSLFSDWSTPTQFETDISTGHLQHSSIAMSIHSSVYPMHPNYSPLDTFALRSSVRSSSLPLSNSLHLFNLPIQHHPTHPHYGSSHLPSASRPTTPLSPPFANDDMPILVKFKITATQSASPALPTGLLTPPLSAHPSSTGGSTGSVSPASLRGVARTSSPSPANTLGATPLVHAADPGCRSGEEILSALAELALKLDAVTAKRSRDGESDDVDRPRKKLQRCDLTSQDHHEQLSSEGDVDLESFPTSEDLDSHPSTMNDRIWESSRAENAFITGE